MQRYTLPNGIAVRHLNRYETDYTYREIFEEQVYLRHGITLEDGAVVLDVGANIGLFSLFVDRVCRAARLCAFEPCPPLYDVLRENLQSARAPARAFPCGLGAQKGTARFTYYPHYTLLSGFHAEGAQDRAVLEEGLRSEARSRFPPGFELPREMLDTLLEGKLEPVELACEMRTVSGLMASEGLERVDLLKIDAERSEMDVLRGVRAEDWPTVRQVAMEVHETDSGDTGTRIRALLEGQGFSVTVDHSAALRDSRVMNLYAVRKS